MNADAGADDSASKRSGRIDAVDCARGLALVGMAIYHLSWDLADFRLAPPMLPFTPQMRLLSHIVASAFLLLVGVSLALAHRNGLNVRAFWRRLAIVAGAAALVTAGSFVFAPSEPITFGILHCIAVASLLAGPFVTAPAWASLAIGVAAIAAPFFIRSTFFDPPWLLWIGLGEALPNTLDWRPLLPWAGVVFLGLGAARLPGVLTWLKRPDRWRAGSAPCACDLLRRPAQPADLSHPSADPDRSPRGADRLGAAGAEGGQERLPRLLPARLRRPRAPGRRVRDRLPMRRRRGRPLRRRRPAGDDHPGAPGRAQAARGRLHGAVSRSGSRLLGSHPRRWPGWSVWIFLACGLSAWKTPILSLGFVWISLDSLVRNETYQWVTRNKPRKIFSCRFSPWRSKRRNERHDLGLRKGRIAHAASLP